MRTIDTKESSGVLNNAPSLQHVNPNLQEVIVGAVIRLPVVTDRVGARLRNT